MIQERSWINLFSKEKQNPFSDTFGFKNPTLDFDKDTHPKIIDVCLKDLNSVLENSPHVCSLA